MIATTSTASATVIQGNQLQNALNNVTLGNQFFDVNTDQFNQDEMWQINASGASINQLLFEFAGFENRAKFGIYDVTNISTKLQIYGGSSCGSIDSSCTEKGDFSTLRYNSQNNYFQAATSNSFIGPGGAGTAFTPTLNGVTFQSSVFGYYLDSGAGIFYSQAALNTEQGQGVDSDHMVAYRGDDNLKLDVQGGTNYRPFGSGEYILAWEDLKFTNSDFDYTDFVVLVESVSSVPEPTTLAFMGLGLAGLGLARRKRKS
jgi:hypothetical protein